MPIVMWKYVLSGKVYPTRVGFTLDIKPDLEFKIKQDDFGIDGVLGMKFTDSDISLIFRTEKEYTQEDSQKLETLKNYIESTVRAVVDVYCFIKSYGYEVEITGIKNEILGLNYVFGVRGEWNINKTQEETNAEFVEIMRVFQSTKGAVLGQAFADFRRSIRYPEMTASFCYRAIETVRQAFFEDSWENLRLKIGLKQEDFDKILKFAKLNRHGKYPVITYAEREEIMNFTRLIIKQAVVISS